MNLRNVQIRIIGAVAAGWLLAAAVPSEWDGLARLVAAYPSFLVSTDKPNVVAWKDGTEMVYDDGIVKTDFEDLLNRASLKDQMAMPYPSGWPAAVPSVNGDPGRVRHEPFFARMYGETEEAVRANLVEVPWAPAGSGATVAFTRVNGAAEALEKVSQEMAALPPESRRYAAEPAGTFNWRTIAGTARRSMHSYGAAIDLKLPGFLYRYWRWEKDPEKPACPPQILIDEKLGQVVRVFEKHGFIWGGKWYHFDTMHFEYRPELAPDVPSR